MCIRLRYLLSAAPTGAAGILPMKTMSERRSMRGFRRQLALGATEGSREAHCCSRPGCAASPEDFVVADGSAVVFVAAAAAIVRVLDATEAIATREQAMADSSAGKPVTQVMGKSYETMLKK